MKDSESIRGACHDSEDEEQPSCSWGCCFIGPGSKARLVLYIAGAVLLLGLLV